MGNINDHPTNNKKKTHSISAAVILSACFFSWLVIYLFDRPTIVFATSNAAVIPASQQIHRIDHSSLLSADIEPAPNPSPAAVAAYESPPQ